MVGVTSQQLKWKAIITFTFLLPKTSLMNGVER